VEDSEHPEADKNWDTDRDETEAQRLDRNWSSLLQELRVAQTGVQLLTGFLLILPFQHRFRQLDGQKPQVYLFTVGCSIGATVLLIAPVSMHRLLFRQHRMKTLVTTSHALRWSERLLGVALPASPSSSSTPLRENGRLIAGGCTLAALAAFWYLMPLLGRSASDDY
jgi:hypothetical protein